MGERGPRPSRAIVSVTQGIAHAQAIAATAAAHGDRRGIRLGGLIRTCPPPIANPTPMGHTPTSPSPSRQQPKTPRKPSTKREPPEERAAERPPPLPRLGCRSRE